MLARWLRSPKNRNMFMLDVDVFGEIYQFHFASRARRVICSTRQKDYNSKCSRMSSYSGSWSFSKRSWTILKPGRWYLWPSYLEFSIT